MVSSVLVDSHMLLFQFFHANAVTLMVVRCLFALVLRHE